MTEVGEVRLSQGRTITDADIVNWAGLVHDFTPLHVDAVLMRNSPFGRPIAHGYIALNLSIGLFFPEHAAWLAPDGRDRSLGWTDVRFLAPVHVGDTLRGRRTVTAVEAGVVTHLVEVLNQDDVVVLSGRESLSRAA